MVQVGHLAYSRTQRGLEIVIYLAYSCAQRDRTSQKDIDVLFSLKLEHFAEFSSSGKPIRKLDITVATAYYLHTCTER